MHRFVGQVPIIGGHDLLDKLLKAAPVSAVFIRMRSYAPGHGLYISLSHEGSHELLELEWASPHAIPDVNVHGTEPDGRILMGLYEGTQGKDVRSRRESTFGCAL